MSTPNEQRSSVQQTELPREPLTEVESRRVEEEALHRTVQSSEEAAESRRRGRIEAETRRVSEEMTRQAQEHEREERMRLQASPAAAGSETETQVVDIFEAARAGRALPAPMTIERVLVPLDGSPYSERALPYSMAFATAVNAAIILAHVQEPARGRARTVLSKAVDSTTGELPLRSVADATAYLNAVRERIGSAMPQVETVILSADSAADGLVEILGQSHADVVVLATHARQGLERRILGSVGDQLIQRTRTPLLLIPPTLEVRAEQTPAFRRVLVPLDGSLLAEEALAPVLTLARYVGSNDSRGMDVVLYYVADSQVTRPEGARYVQDARKRLLEAQLPEAITITATAMVGSPPGSITSAGIHGVITEPMYPERFDFVAMATHGRGGIQRWLYGSVAEYVLSHAAVPTLLVHPERTDM